MRLELTLENDAQIRLRYCLGRGLENRGFVKNLFSGSISFYDVRADAVFNYDSVYNNGSLSIDKMTLGGGMVNLGGLDNDRNISVTNCEGISISNNSGLFTNSGTITINPIQADSSHHTGLRNFNGILTNEVNGNIFIANIFGDDPALLNTGTFTNQGDINLNRLEDDGIENSGTFINQNEIYIQECQGRGLWNIEIFTNSFGARVDVVNFSNTKHTQTGIRNSQDFGNGSAIFNNHGFLNIQKVIAAPAVGFQNSGTFFHTDTLVITAANTGLSNNSNVEFDNQGYIHINGSQVLSLGNSGNFTNSEKIIIENSENNGIINSDTLVNSGILELNIVDEIAINNSSLFQNEPNGSFSINNAKNGLSGLGSGMDTAFIKNHGLIEISNITEKAINSQWLSKIDNYDSIIVNGAFTGIHNAFQFTNHSNAFIKTSDITGSGSLGYGILSDIGFTHFRNESCGIIELEGGVRYAGNVTGSSFANDGLIIQRSTVDNSLSFDITNNGIWSNISGIDADTAKMINNGMYLEPISGNFTCGDVVNSFYNGNATGITGTYLFIDSLGTTSAGSMNIGANSLNPNNQNQNLQIFLGRYESQRMSIHRPNSF